MSDNTQSHFDAIIVGGGAAGLWAAGTAAARGRRVLVIEKNPKLGVKILMSGGTRCNITHDCSSAEVAQAFGPEGRALLSPLSRLSPKQVVDVFHQLGVETKSEPAARYFQSVIRLLMSAMLLSVELPKQVRR